MSYYKVRLHANRRIASVTGREEPESLGWRGRFYSALRPELDLRLSARMGDAELAGQSHLESLPVTERPHFSFYPPHNRVSNICSFVRSLVDSFVHSSVRSYAWHLFGDHADYGYQYRSWCYFISDIWSKHTIKYTYCVTLYMYIRHKW